MRRVVIWFLMLCLLLAALSGAPAVEAEECRALDPKSEEFKEAFSALWKAKLICPYTECELAFDWFPLPEDRVSYAGWLVGVLGWKEAVQAYEGPAPFDDVNEPWAYGYIAVLKAAGIVQGDETGHFRPRQPVTYGEALLMLARLFRLNPDFTVAEAEAGLQGLGINTHVQCGGYDAPLTLAQSWVLAHRAMSVPFRPCSARLKWPAEVRAEVRGTPSGQLITENHPEFKAVYAYGGCFVGGKGPPPDWARRLNRGEFGLGLLRPLGIQQVAVDYTGEAAFQDTPPGLWSSGTTIYLHRLGIARGDGQGNYKPTATITQVEAQLMVARTLLADPNVTLANAADALYRIGVDPIISDEGPAAPVTLAQAWVLIDRAMAVTLYGRHKR